TIAHRVDRVRRDSRRDHDRRILRAAHRPAHGEDAADLRGRVGRADARGRDDADEAHSRGAAPALSRLPQAPASSRARRFSEFLSRLGGLRRLRPILRGDATAGRGGLALPNDARLLVVALLAKVLQHAGLLYLALELLERPVEAIRFVESDFDHLIL